MEEKANRIDIDQDFLSDFLNGTNGTGEAESDQASKVDKAIDKVFDRGAGWVLSLIDNKAQEYGYPGLCGMPPKELGSLTIIALEEEFGITLNRDSAFGMLCTVGAGIITANVMHGVEQHLIRQKLESKKENKESKSGESNAGD